MKKAGILSAVAIVLAALLVLITNGGRSEPAQMADGLSLEVHFLDVGQADCALVLCEGEALLVDGGNREDSSLLYSYLRDHSVTYLNHIVATHPHEDHIGGLQAAIAAAGVGDVYSPVSESDNGFFVSLKRRLDDGGIPLVVPSVGDSFSVGGAKATFLGPTRVSDEENNNSLVFRLDYGDVSFLFTGDAETAEENDILESGANLKCTVLKVGHHGSAGSSGYAFLRAAVPDYAVISTEDNSRYGHPHEAALSRLGDAGAAIYRTDKCGTIVFRSDGAVLTVETEKGAGGQVEASAENGGETPMYIGNVSSGVYHRPDCRSLPAEHNRINFYSLEEALNAGYRPCGFCKPGG